MEFVIRNEEKAQNDAGSGDVREALVYDGGLAAGSSSPLTYGQKTSQLLCPHTPDSATY